MADLDRMTQGRMNRGAGADAGRGIECGRALDARHRHRVGAAEGARQGRRQALFRARHRDPCRRRRHRPARAMAADRRRTRHRDPLRVAGLRDCSAICAGSRASAVSASDGRYDLEAKAVIACAGGFQANAEMRARYLAGNTDMMKVRGTQARHRRGAALCCSISARRPAGQWQSGHMSPIDANAPDVETPQHEDGRGNTQSRYDYPYGITVNALGLRFFDEGEAQHSYTYAKTGRAVLGAAGRDAHSRSTIRRASPACAIRTTRRPSSRPITIAELARKGRARAGGARRTRSRSSTARCRDDAAIRSAPPDGKATRGSRSRNRTGRSASTSRRSAPIRSPAASPSPSAASRSTATRR